MPPLRERREDILPLARVFLVDAASGWGERCRGSRPDAADQLQRHDWPGNVRELRNAMERAVALSRGPRVELEDLPEDVRTALPAPVLTGEVRTLEELEREYILAVLARNGGTGRAPRRTWALARPRSTASSRATSASRAAASGEPRLEGPSAACQARQAMGPACLHGRHPLMSRERGRQCRVRIPPPSAPGSRA